MVAQKKVKPLADIPSDTGSTLESLMVVVDKVTLVPAIGIQSGVVIGPLNRGLL